MTRRWLAIGTLLGFLAMLVAAAFAIWNYRKLAEDIANGRAELASTRSQLMIASDAAIANRQLVEAAIGVANALRPRCVNPRTTADLNICSLLRTTPTTPAYVEFLASYTDATAKRVRASSADDFASIENIYRDLVPKAEVLGNEGAAKQWLARAKEGIAYAQWRQGKLDEGAATIAQAAELDPASAFVGMTSLKIMCARKRPAGEVRKAYSDLSARLARLKAEAARSPFRAVAENAALEDGYLRADDSIDYFCGYAQLERR